MSKGMKGAVGLCLGLLLGCALPATSSWAAQEEPTQPRSDPHPEELARDGVELLLRALQGFLEALPSYGLPFLDEEGNIIIPRLDPSPLDPSPLDPSSPDSPPLDPAPAPGDPADKDSATGGIRT